MIGSFSLGSIFLIQLLLSVRCQDFSSERVGNSQFHVFLSQLVFSEAITECQRMDNNTELASVRNIEEFQFLERFFADNFISELIFLGMTRPENSDGQDPLSFEFVDGFQDKTFIANPGVLPWSENEPSGGEQTCVIWHIPGNDFIETNRWDDSPCDKAGPFLCRTQFSSENGNEMFSIYETSLLVSAVILLLLTTLSVHKLYKKSRKYKRVKLRLEIEIMKNNQFKDFKLPNVPKYTFSEDQSTVHENNSEVNGYESFHSNLPDSATMNSPFSSLTSAKT